MKSRYTARQMAQIGLMAAVVYVVTLFRFPLLGSKVHFANAMCLLSALLLGPADGALAAGFGSLLYDVTLGGYPLLPDGLITFVTKALMALCCALIAGRPGKRNAVRVIAASVAGSLSYVVLYLFKTWVMQRFVYGYAPDVVWATVLSKAPASLLNAAAAAVAAPVLYGVLAPQLKSLRLPRWTGRE